MPYIKQDRRTRINKLLDEVISEITCQNNFDYDGELNYAISYLVATAFGPIWRYHYIARAISVFECAKLEFYRRIAAPYEDKAIAKNGDITPYEKTK